MENHITHVYYTFLALAISTVASGQNSPSEFLQSYINRPNLLTSHGPMEPKLKDDKYVSVSVYVDNWSAHNLVYNAHAVHYGGLENAFPPRDMSAKRRGFALRTLGTTKDGQRTGGMVGWTLMSPKGQTVSRLSAAWDVDLHKEQGSQAKFSLAFGDFVPQYEEMWENRANGELYSTVGQELNKAVVLADIHVTISVNMTKAQGNNFHLTITLVPQNVDVWGWQKYFKEADDDDEVQERTQTPLPQVTNKRLQGSQTASKRDKGTKNQQNDIDDQLDGKPLYERKDLLQFGPEYYSIQAKGHSFRDSLRESASKRSAAVGFHIENWSRFIMGTPSVEIISGSSVIRPQAIEPGRQEVAIIGNEGFMTGTNGVLRWTLGSSERVLSLMWSVPHSRQFWRTWVAVGLTSKDKTPSFDFMYNGADETRFVRQEAGREFEFSDGHFIVIARMDGGSTFKPVLHVGLIPIDETDLAGSIRRGLGRSVVKRDDLTELVEPPQFRLRQSTSGGAPSVRAQTAVLANATTVISILTTALVFLLFNTITTLE